MEIVRAMTSGDFKPLTENLVIENGNITLREILLLICKLESER